MLVESFLGWLVVVGRDGKNPLDTQPLDLLRQLDNLFRAVSADPCDDRRLAGCFLEHEADHSEVFTVLECGRFPGRPAGHKEVNPLAKLELH